MTPACPVSTDAGHLPPFRPAGRRKGIPMRLHGIDGDSAHDPRTPLNAVIGFSDLLQYCLFGGRLL
jgi:hypothetical protein